jgi:hypothetical protein
LFDGTHNPITLITQSLLYAAAGIAASAAQFSPPALVLALILPAGIAYSQRPLEIPRGKLRGWILLSALVGFGLIVLVNLPAIYATSRPPAARVYIIPQFVLVCTCVVIGYLAGRLARKTRLTIPRGIAAPLLILLLIAGPLYTAWQMIQTLPKLSTYAAEWDQRERLIRSAGDQQDVIVPPLSVDLAATTGLDTIGSDTSAFTNSCAAAYYGVPSIRTEG